MFLERERERETERDRDRDRDRERARCRDCSAFCLKRGKHYIFGNQFNSKNATRFRFYLFLHFHARKHMIS